MYKRMKPSEYIERTYAGDRKPCLATIKRMIDRQQLAGEVDAAGKYWVLVDDAGKPAPATQEQAANELVQTGDALADALMADFLHRNNAA
jgi:hypothetical protein